MKRLAVLACVLSLVAVGCNKSISPTVPSGMVTLVAQLSGASNVPPAGYAGMPGALEAAARGTIQLVLTPATGGDFTASLTLNLAGMITKATAVAAGLPSPLNDGTVIVAGYIHSGAAGAVGAPVLALPISQTAPLISPTGTVLITMKGIAVPAATAAAIVANPAGFYFNLYSALNQNGIMRGQLVKQ